MGKREYEQEGRGQRNATQDNAMQRGVRRLERESTKKRLYVFVSGYSVLILSARCEDARNGRREE